MFDLDGIFNYIIFLIPLALVVSRVVGRFKAKKNPPPPVKKKPAEPFVPVHFEVDKPEKVSKVEKPDKIDEDDDYLTSYFKKRNAAENTTLRPQTQTQTTRRKTQKNVAAPFTPKLELSSPLLSPPVVARSVELTSPRRTDFGVTLNHLSPLKQALIMSEVLGQPKGMRGLWGERPGQGE